MKEKLEEWRKTHENETKENHEKKTKRKQWPGNSGLLRGEALKMPLLSGVRSTSLGCFWTSRFLARFVLPAVSRQTRSTINNGLIDILSTVNRTKFLIWNLKTWDVIWPRKRVDLLPPFSTLFQPSNDCYSTLNNGRISSLSTINRPKFPHLESKCWTIMRPRPSSTDT